MFPTSSCNTHPTVMLWGDLRKHDCTYDTGATVNVCMHWQSFKGVLPRGESGRDNSLDLLSLVGLHSAKLWGGRRQMVFHSVVRVKSERARSGKGLYSRRAPPKVPNFSRSIFALYGILRGSTGCLNRCFQVLALRRILRLSTTKKSNFQIEVGFMQICVGKEKDTFWTRF